MTVYRLIIKGTAEEAKAAAAARGIGLRSATIWENRNAAGVWETVAYCSAPHDALSRWFCEPSQCAPEGGFPAGTLLHFTG